MLTAGIDIGSTMTKVVILQDDEIRASEIIWTGSEHRATAYQVMDSALKRENIALKDIDYIVGTGYGRLNIPFADKQITEISCHGKGIAKLFPQAHTVIEIGGQDCKCIRLQNGKVVKFCMNEKCAAGTGRFFQAIADMLQLGLDEMNEMALSATEGLPISNKCAIFAMSEIVSALSADIPAGIILAGVFDSFSQRIIKMARTQGIERDVVLTGGGSMHKALRTSIEKNLGYSILTPAKPLLTGAFGAAILAAEQVKKNGAGNRNRALSAITVE